MILETFSHITGYIIGFLSKLTTENVTVIGGILAIIKWLYETQKQRKWETNKYLVERLKEFEGKITTDMVHEILDYNAGIPIRLGIKKVSEKFINDEIVIESLKTHDEKQNFNDLEVGIRGVFDEYFDGLTELILMSKCGLIDKKNLKLLLEYYINIMNGKSKSKSDEYVKQIKKYLTFYNYDLVLEFIE